MYNEELLDKFSIGTITWKTWLTSGLTIIAAINEILMILGIQTPISQLSEGTLSTALAIIFLVAVRWYSWWHNNSITKKAQMADYQYNIAGAVESSRTPNYSEDIFEEDFKS